MTVRGAYTQADGGVIPVGGVRMRASVFESFAAKAGELATLVLLATLVPRALGPEAYGRFAVPLTIVTLGSLAMSLGGPTLLARYVPVAPPDERLALARAIGARLARARALLATGLGLGVTLTGGSLLGAAAVLAVAALS